MTYQNDNTPHSQVKSGTLAADAAAIVLASLVALSGLFTIMAAQQIF